MFKTYQTAHIIQHSPLNTARASSVVLAEKKRKDDLYRKRIEMAKRHFADGRPSLTMEDIRKSCRAHADEIERQICRL